MDRGDVSSNVFQALQEHGILDVNANPQGSVSTQKEEVPVALVWGLYQKVNRDLTKSKDVSNKQVNELQRYVENVRQLSEERDRLTMEFEAENETMKLKLADLKKKQEEEEKQISEMCHNEKMTELTCKSRTEQVAYLLRVRSNLLEKLAVTEKVKTKHNDLEKQLHDLRNEDSDLRNHMELAMSEMGGMANKLTSAIQERDRFKRQVAQLNQTLTEVKGLPVQNVNNMAAKTQIMALENSVNYYVAQIERLTGELDKSKTQARIREAELMSELKEYKDMSADGGGKVPVPVPRQMGASSYLLPESQQQLQAKSKQLITEMEAALHTDGKAAEERETKHRDELSKLEARIKELEATVQKNADDKSTPKFSTIEYQELKAQMVEIDRQYKVAKAEEAECREKMHRVQRDLAKIDAQYKQSQRQLSTQSEISFGLKQRNDELELELAKTLNELQTSNEKQGLFVSGRRRFEKEMEQNQHEIKDLKEYISELKRKHDKEIRDLKLSKDEKSRLKSYESSETKRVSELQIQLTEAQTLLEIEKGKRFTAEEDLETAKLDFESTLKKKEELSRELDDLYMSNENLEHQLEILSGKYEDIQGGKLVKDMTRQQLEDVTNAMTVRFVDSLDKSHDFSEKYVKLKQKHKAKIRKIRELLMMERGATAEEVEKLEMRVLLAESALEQELAWKQKAIDDVKATAEEHRKAVNREDEARKNAEKTNVELHEALSKYHNLSDENKMLHNQLDHLEKQKMEIERSVNKEQKKSELNALLGNLNRGGTLPTISTKKLPPIDILNESGFNETSTCEFFPTASVPSISTE